METENIVQFSVDGTHVPHSLVNFKIAQKRTCTALNKTYYRNNPVDGERLGIQYQQIFIYEIIFCLEMISAT